MAIEPNDLLLFARIVETGSFTQAALRVDLPKSTVSRRLALLEASLGERLLQRTTRKLMVTEFGASLLEHARKVAEEVEAAGALAQHRQAEPSGRLRISMPADIANLVMTGVMARFLVKYPSVSLELDLSPRRVDLVAENFDIAIRMGDLPDDSSLSARRVVLGKTGTVCGAVLSRAARLAGAARRSAGPRPVMHPRAHRQPDAVDAAARQNDVAAWLDGAPHGQLARTARAHGVQWRRHRGQSGHICRPARGQGRAGAGVA